MSKFLVSRLAWPGRQRRYARSRMVDCASRLGPRQTCERPRCVCRNALSMHPQRGAAEGLRAQDEAASIWSRAPKTRIPCEALWSCWLNWYKHACLPSVQCCTSTISWPSGLSPRAAPSSALISQAKADALSSATCKCPIEMTCKSSVPTRCCKRTWRVLGSVEQRGWDAGAVVSWPSRPVWFGCYSCHLQRQTGVPCPE